MKAIVHEIKGIKCDNPDCGWCDMEAEFLPEKWLNVPCPDCGSNLFTEAAYEQMKTTIAMINAINEMAKSLGLVKTDDERINIELIHNEEGLISGMKVLK